MQGTTLDKCARDKEEHKCLFRNINEEERDGERFCGCVLLYFLKKFEKKEKFIR